jgi:hypothetical protein
MTFAELSLALGGFTGIVLALRSRGGGGLGIPRPLLESILLIVFGAAIIPLICVAALNFGTDPSVAWRIGSLLMVAIAVAWFGAVRPRLKQTPTPSSLPGWLAVFVFGISAANGLAQAFNVFGAFPSHGFAVLFAGLTWYFASGAIAFSHILTGEDAA